MMMQPYMTIIKILVCRNYSVCDEPHFLKKLRGNLTLFLLINVWWVDIYCTSPDVSGKDRGKWIFCRRIDSAEPFVFLFIYSNTQFPTKTQSIFRMRKVDSSLLVLLHWSIQNSSCTLDVPVFIVAVSIIIFSGSGGSCSGSGSSSSSSSSSSSRAAAVVMIHNSSNSFQNQVITLQY